jgi:hypothetical protein
MNKRNEIPNMVPAPGPLCIHGPRLLSPGAQMWLFWVSLSVTIVAAIEGLGWAVMGYFVASGPILRWVIALVTGIVAAIVVRIVDAQMMTLDIHAAEERQILLGETTVSKRSAWRRAGPFLVRLVLLGLSFRVLLPLLLLAGLPALGIAQMSPIFGPKRYTQRDGKPHIFTDTFLNCEMAAQYDLVVATGESDGGNRVRRASIVLNGTEVKRLDDSDGVERRVTKPITVSSRNTLQVQLDSRSGDFLTISIRCRRNCLTVRITTPASGDDLSAALANVEGIVESSADEVGIRVVDSPSRREEDKQVLSNRLDDQRGSERHDSSQEDREDIETSPGGNAALVQDGHFVAANVPLALGENIIRATATNACLNRAAATERVSVTALTPPALTVSAAPNSGLAPLTVTFTASVSSPNPITNYQWDFNGDGVVESSGPALSSASNTYAQPGLYLATVTATDSVGNRFTGRVPVLMHSFTELNTLLEARWNGLVAALSGQNVSQAIAFFHPAFAPQFSDAFTKLSDQLPMIGSSLTNASLLSEAGGVAEIVTIRTQQGTTYAYFIFFMQDEFGLWKIVSM